MFGKLKTKSFWKIIALSFILWFVFNLLTEWAFTERDERSFSPLFIRDVIMNALFMSIMFSVFFQQPGEQFTANADRGMKYYAGLFLFTFITVFFLALILLLSTFLLFSLFDTLPIQSVTPLSVLFSQ